MNTVSITALVQNIYNLKRRRRCPRRSAPPQKISGISNSATASRTVIVHHRHHVSTGHTHSPTPTTPRPAFSPGICQIFPHPPHRNMAPKIQSKIYPGQPNHAHSKMWSVRILTYGLMHMTKDQLFIKVIGPRVRGAFSSV